MDVAGTQPEGERGPLANRAESGPVASSCGGHSPGFRVYEETRNSPTFSRRHSSGCFSAAIASQRR